jgi:hypothetical protein
MNMVVQGQNIKESPGYKAGRAVSGLRDLKIALGILQAAYVMSIEGLTRSTAGEIAERVNKDLQDSTTPSIVGQFLRGLNIDVAVTHGKPRLVLDPDRLKILKDNIAKACEETAAELEAALKGFQDLTSRIKGLEDEWNEIIRLRARERQLVQQIEEQRRTPSRLPAVEQELARLQKEASRADDLRKECEELSKKIKVLPMIQGRKVALNNSIKRYQEDEAQVRAGESRLGQALEDLKKRSAWVTYIDLDRNIQRQRTELTQITAQLNERRPLLQKILGTNKVR